MIQFQNVSKCFANQTQVTHAVKDVSLTIPQGEIFGIIGYSGAGKSTLLRLVNQLEKHDEGSIFIDGQDITQYSKKQTIELRRNIGMIFQHFNLLWSKTVYQNIALPLEIIKTDKEAMDNKVRELIKLVGLEGKENAYPATLSGGQKQRVAIARAIANNPKILLCDEATSALDPKTTDSIIQLLKDINKKLNITIVLITHQMEVVEKLCHTTAIMVEGQIVETNKTSNLFKNPKNDATRHFIQTRNQIDDEEQRISTLKKIYTSGTILKLSFDENTTNQNIIYNVSIQSKIPFSVVCANIITTIDNTLGVMYIHTDNQDYTTLINEFLQLGVQTEVITQ